MIETIKAFYQLYENPRSYLKHNFILKVYPAIFAKIEVFLEYSLVYLHVISIEIYKSTKLRYHIYKEKLSLKLKLRQSI